jgi:cell division cycle 20-like protein 1, cofactor of APC complex
LAVGLQNGMVQIWDPAGATVAVQTIMGHCGRVSALTWNSSGVTSGSRDHMVLHRDVREGTATNGGMRFVGHRQEVCGLRWSPDEQMLASGGNDNKLLLWSATNGSAPMLRLSEHKAAVKAIAWSPHQRGLVASGGGTADRCIRIWNSVSTTPVQTVDTMSQVCNLAWSRNVNELVSTHGYSQNQVVVWSYPALTPIATLTGHTMRVLYLAVSPDGQNIVTGAGDETLRFWNVFPPPAAAVAAADQSMFRHPDIR